MSEDIKKADEDSIWVAVAIFVVTALLLFTILHRKGIFSVIENPVKGFFCIIFYWILYAVIGAWVGATYRALMRIYWNNCQREGEFKHDRIIHLMAWPVLLIAIPFIILATFITLFA